MKIGQTSIVYFVSKLLATAFGFLATLYIARLLGPEVLGSYYLAIGLVAWLSIVGRIGVTDAIIKRVSEGEEQGSHVTAGSTIIAVLFIVTAAALFVAKPYVDQYIGFSATLFVILILFVTLVHSAVSSVLTGLRLVHVNGVLTTVKIGSRSVFQILAVIAGLEIVGLFFGYIAGFVVVIALGGVVIGRNLKEVSLPQKRHFRSLADFAKFSWLGSLQSKMFSYTDILVLGLFTPSALIGVYSIAWNISEFLIIFATAISTTLFPEISQLSTDSDNDSRAIRNLVENALAYAGLFLVPGLIGGAVIGERLLRIYGKEFTQGATILVILIVANLVMSYQNQILNTLNAINRPELAFRVNGLFVVANVSLNVLLIYRYGWIGAAVATSLSVTISLLLGYYYLRSLIAFEVPYREIARQWVAATIMGGVVFGGLRIEEGYDLLSNNVATVLVLVGAGAIVYFGVYFYISRRFRDTVANNLPFDVRITQQL